MTLDEILEVVQASKAGCIIEEGDFGATPNWRKFHGIGFDFSKYRYRKKPTIIWLSFDEKGRFLQHSFAPKEGFIQFEERV